MAQRDYVRLGDGSASRAPRGTPPNRFVACKKFQGACMPSPVTVLCTSGLAVEAKIARAAGFSVVVGAGDRYRTKTLVETVAARTKCLVSFGIAGGLAPGLKAGTVVVSGDVVSERQRWSVDAQYRDRLGEFARDIGAIEGPVFGAT